MSEVSNRVMSVEEAARFLNFFNRWLKEFYPQFDIGGYEDTNGEIFDIYLIKRELPYPIKNRRDKNCDTCNHPYTEVCNECTLES